MNLGLNHVTLAVRDADESFSFYVEILKCVPMAKWPEGAYLLAGGTWLALVQDPKIRSGPLPEYTHVAFYCSQADFPEFRRRILDSGTREWQENSTQGDSLYFLDPNGHKLEIHVSGLEARLETARRDPWEGLYIFEENVQNLLKMSP